MFYIFSELIRLLDYIILAHYGKNSSMWMWSFR